MYTKRYTTDMENQQLLRHSSLHCLVSFLSNTIIYLSFLPSFPPAPSSTQHLLCTSRMLLPSGEIPSAAEFVVRDRSQKGMGKLLEAKIYTRTRRAHTHTHTQTVPVKGTRHSVYFLSLDHFLHARYNKREKISKL